MLSVFVFASVSVSVFAQQKGWVLCCVNGKDENRCKMSYRIRVVGNMKTIKNLIPCCAKTVDAKCQTGVHLFDNMMPNLLTMQLDPMEQYRDKKWLVYTYLDICLYIFIRYTGHR